MSKPTVTLPRFLLPTGLLAALALLVFLSQREAPAETSSPQGAPPPRVLTVATQTLSLQSSYAVEDRYLGQIEAARESQLGFELSGTLDSIEVDEGDAVQAGQLLATLDTARLQAALRQQQAALKEATSALTLAQATFDRATRLEQTGAVSQQDLDQAIQQRDSTTAAITRTEAAIESIQVDLAKSELRAPFDGRIAHRNLDEGTTVSPGQLVLEVIESGVLEARIGVPAGLAAQARVGAEVDLIQRRSGEAVSATVTRILPRQDLRTRTIDVMLAIDPEAEAMPGDLVSWTHAHEVTADGVWLPRQALTSSARGLWAVYAAVALDGEDSGLHRLERREVEVVHTDADQAYVRGALDSGDRVVADGLQRLVPDQRVKTVPATVVASHR